MNNITDLTIIMVGYENSDIVRLARRGIEHTFPQAAVIVQNPNTNLPPGSLQHAHGVTTALKRGINTDYILIIDSDTILTSAHWFSEPFDWMCSRKSESTVHMCFLAGRTDIIQAANFLPQGPGPGYNALTDVGSRLGVPDTKIVHVDCKSGAGQILGSEHQSGELWFNDRVIAVHQGRGSNLAGKIIKGGRKPIAEQSKDFYAQLNAFFDGV